MSLMDAIVKNLFFPKKCLFCKRWGSYVCVVCMNNRKIYGQQRCPYCFKRNHLGLTHVGCTRRTGIDGAYALFSYHSIQNVIKESKFRLAYEVLLDFLKAIPLSYMGDFVTLCSIVPHAVIIPIPLHKKRFHRRGFNQSLYIAQYLHTIMPLDIDNESLVRIKHTSAQSMLEHRKERMANISNAFAIRKGREKDIAGKDCILVDDIWTTGETSKKAGSVLKKAGACRVLVWTLAR